MSSIERSAPHPKSEKRKGKKGNKPRRIEDPKAIMRAKLAHPHCAACGHYGGNGHHVLPKDKFGDDVEDNIVVLCGSGTERCHGAHHGSPYVVKVSTGTVVNADGEHTERRDAEWVNRRVGVTLLRDRPEVIEYVIAKLGQRDGSFFLEQAYYITGLPQV